MCDREGKGKRRRGTVAVVVAAGGMTGEDKS